MTGRGPGASNQTAGYRWQHPLAFWLRDNGWPLAASARRGVDLVAGPVAIDATTTTWDKIWAKLDKVIRDGAVAGLPYAAVWKKRNKGEGEKERGSKDPVRGMIMMQADQFFDLVKSLEYEQERAAAAERDLERWMARERAG